MRMGGIEGGEYAVTILNELGPTLENVVAKADAGMTKQEIAVLVLIAATRGLTPKLYKQIRDVFIKRCSVEMEMGKWPKLELVFDSIFENSYAAQMNWFKSCFVGEFESFLGTVTELFGVGLSEKAKSE